MVTISFYAKDFEGKSKVRTDSLYGFRSHGHAGYSDEGHDIVCAAISALIINAMDSIAELSKDVYSYDEDQDKGFIDFKITSAVSPTSSLFLQSLLLGLSNIQANYGDEFLKIEFQHS